MPRRSTARRGGGSAAASSIREVDAGSCNGCELEIHALNNAFYDLERFGLRFVASPRHADVLLVTGPVTKNMREALERTYTATPDPKWVVAVGDCARRWRHLRRQLCGAPAASSDVVPVDLHIPGCPPSPTELFKGCSRSWSMGARTPNICRGSKTIDVSPNGGTKVSHLTPLLRKVGHIPTLSDCSLWRRGWKWCPGAESNHRHCDFQSHALPTELPGRRAARASGVN